MKEKLNQFLIQNSHLSENEREEILKYFAILQLKKNEFWIKKNEICNSIAFVVSGILRTIHEMDEEETTMQFYYSDSFTGSLTSFVFQTPSIWSIQALTDCTLLIIERENHFKLVNEYKNWLEIYNVQLLKAYIDLENRIYSQFHLTSQERFIKLFSVRKKTHYFKK